MIKMCFVDYLEHLRRYEEIKIKNQIKRKKSKHLNTISVKIWHMFPDIFFFPFKTVSDVLKILSVLNFFVDIIIIII